MNPPSAVAAYLRVSTEEQAEEGLSLQAQEARVRAYCAMRGFDLSDLIIDAGVSAGKPLAAREGGRRLLELVRSRRAAAVVSWKLDRLFRDCADCLTVTAGWDRASAALHLIDLGGQAVDTSTAMGRFFLTVMAGAAELERNQLRERTAAAMQHKAGQGQFCGGQPPFGQRVASDGVRLEDEPAEQAVLALVRELHDAGTSLRGIVAELDLRNFRNRAGNPFSLTQVVRMLAAS